MIRLAIFDFDGTLGDTLELILKCNHETRHRMGAKEIPDQAIIACIGIPLRGGIAQMNPGMDMADMPKWVETYLQVFQEFEKHITPGLFPGVKDTITKLYEAGITLTVASSRETDSLNNFLRKMGLAPYFKYVLGAEDVTKAKPDPEPVLKTQKDLGFRPEETLVVGDMPVDIRMGRGAGAKTCGVTFGNSTPEALKAAGADYIIDSFSQLTEIVIDRQQG